jgi:type II secretory pathway pseudopilin PulG
MTRIRNTERRARRHQTYEARRSGLVAGSAAGTAFTMIEVLLALAISAIVLVAIQAVFATAVRLRDKASFAVEESLPVNQAFDTMRTDLKGAVGPNGILAGAFKCGASGMGSPMGASVDMEGIGLDFFTTTGLIQDDAPWGDLQEIFYQLVPPTDRTQAGRDLVRNVNRNPLAVNNNQQVPETDRLMSHVETLEIECFDGLEWRMMWDTTQSDTNLPLAVMIRITPAAKENQDPRMIRALQMIVPLMIQTRTNQTLTTATNTASE